MQELELDAFFQKYRIVLEVQGAHSQKTWGIVIGKKDVCVKIFLLEVWYDEEPEIVIPERIRKVLIIVHQIDRKIGVQT